MPCTDATAPDAVLLSIVLPTFLYIGSWSKADLHYIIFLAPLAGLLATHVMVDFSMRLQLAWALVFLALFSAPNV